MAQRTTRKLLELLVAQCQAYTGCMYELNCMHLEGPRYRLCDGITGRDISPRLKASEMEDWLRTYFAGMMAMVELCNNPIRERFAIDHDMSLGDVEMLVNFALQAGKDQEYAHNNDSNPVAADCADRAMQQFTDYAKQNCGIHSVRWPGLYPQVCFNNLTNDWFDLPID